VPLNLVEALGRHTAVHRLVDHDRGRARAVAEAVHGLEAEAAVVRRLMEIDAELLARVVLERARAHRLARLGTADVDGLFARRLRAKEMIESDDAMHLGAREVQHLGDDGHGGFRHEAEPVLNRMQNGQQRAGLARPRLGQSTDFGIARARMFHWMRGPEANAHRGQHRSVPSNENSEADDSRLRSAGRGAEIVLEINVGDRGQ
jgi:hypothetical protein